MARVIFSKCLRAEGGGESCSSTARVAGVLYEWIYWTKTRTTLRVDLFAALWSVLYHPSLSLIDLESIAAIITGVERDGAE